MWKGRRRKKLLLVPFPTEWRRVIETSCPFYHWLTASDRRELEGHIQIFLAEKKFEGCGGLELTEGIKVCIAAYACLLLLHRETDYYPSLRTVLVYPSSYVAPTTRHVGSGVLEESLQTRAGESWQHGTVVVAWDAVCSSMGDPDSGDNLVLHEFAHQLDYEDGEADGAPLLGRGESRAARKQRYANWSQVMRAEYERLQGQVQRGEPALLRAYGATNPAEFFAVATECFFGQPRELRQRHLQLYEQMKWYYQQDPAQWPPVQQSG